MAKDPAFLFYSQDFFVGTATMSFEDRGKYITLLCLMHQKGRMDMQSICSLVGQPSASLIGKFSVDPDGNYYNERLELEAEKRKNYTESRRNNAKRGKTPPQQDVNPKNKSEHMLIHMQEHKEDENENSNYLTPKMYLLNRIEVDLQQLNMKSRLSPEDFDFCLTQWSLKAEESGWTYTEDAPADLKRLRAGFEKWLNSWTRNERNVKTSVSRKNSAETIIDINQMAKNGISND